MIVTVYIITMIVRINQWLFWFYDRRIIVSVYVYKNQGIDNCKKNDVKYNDLYLFDVLE